MPDVCSLAPPDAMICAPSDPHFSEEYFDNLATIEKSYYDLQENFNELYYEILDDALSLTGNYIDTGQPAFYFSEVKYPIANVIQQ